MTGGWVAPSVRLSRVSAGDYQVFDRANGQSLGFAYRSRDGWMAKTLAGVVRGPVSSRREAVSECLIDRHG